MIARGAGRVVRTLGETVVAVLPGARVGDGARIRRSDGEAVGAEITAVERSRVRLAPFGSVAGIGVGDRVETAPEALAAPCGFALLGRAIDAAGRPLDGGPVPAVTLGGARGVPEPQRRRKVAVPFWTGVPAIDGLLTVGRGARVGLFGPPGAGKSSLIEAIVGGAHADAVVLALIGERGREAGRWLERLDRRTTVVCATSDKSASERIRAADIAMTHAATLRDRGLAVLLVVDSLARYAGALRERRIATGEPTGRGGYPPGLFADLAHYLERAGNAGDGSVTALVTVLSEGDGDDDPLAEAARSLLDGHVVLAAELAQAGRFPAIDVLRSASRTMTDVVDGAHLRAAARVRAALAVLAATRDARELGFAVAADAAAAARHEAALEAFLRANAPLPPGAMARALATLAAALAGESDGPALAAATRTRD